MSKIKNRFIRKEVGDVEHRVTPSGTLLHVLPVVMVYEGRVKDVDDVSIPTEEILSEMNVPVRCEGTSRDTEFPYEGSVGMRVTKFHFIAYL